MTKYREIIRLAELGLSLQIPVDWCVHSRISGAPILK